VVKTGQFEAFVNIDGFDFAVALLERGAVLNARNILYDGKKKMFLNIKCT
jgi:hypothetical protein